MAKVKSAGSSFMVEGFRVPGKEEAFAVVPEELEHAVRLKSRLGGQILYANEGPSPAPTPKPVAKVKTEPPKKKAAEPKKYYNKRKRGLARGV